MNKAQILLKEKIKKPAKTKNASQQRDQKS